MTSRSGQWSIIRSDVCDLWVLYFRELRRPPLPPFLSQGGSVVMMTRVAAALLDQEIESVAETNRASRKGLPGCPISPSQHTLEEFCEKWSHGFLSEPL